MKDQDKREYEKIYKAAKAQGEPFYPNAIIKDVLVSLGIFLILVLLSAFFRAELQAPADPADASYIPHPEWYFLFLYEMLKYFPGNLVILGVIVFPAAVFLILFLLPWLDRSKERHPRKRPVVMASLVFAWVVIIGFTVLGITSAPHQAETVPAVAGVNSQQTNAGQEVFVEQCSGCHGQYGEGGPHPSKPGEIIPPISSHGFLTTFTDDTLFNIVSNGLPDQGMASFSQRNGGPLDDSKIELVVAYLRHWETNPPVVAAYVPPTPRPKPTDVPGASGIASADTGDQGNGVLLFKSWCANCHGPDAKKPIGPQKVIIVDPAFLKSKSDADLVDILNKGFPKPDDMPAFKDILATQDMSDLLAWLRKGAH